MARPVYQKRGRSADAARLAREERQAVAEAKAADVARRRIGTQPDLFGAPDVEHVAPRRPMPSTWEADLRRYHRADCLGDR